MEPQAQTQATPSPEEKRALLARLLAKKRERIKTVPLSFAQQRLWFLEQLEPGNSTYNSALPLLIQGTLQVKALKQSIQEILQRHETLRTTFTADKGQPLQIVRPHAQVKLPLIDLKALTEDSRLRIAHRLANEETMYPFDLVNSPPIRTTLLRITDTHHFLLISIHHIATDAWSQQLLLREIITLYDAFVHNKPSPLPPLSLHYSDFAMWQRNWLQGKVLEEHIQYWREQLRGAMALELPTDHPYTDTLSHQGANIYFTLSPTLSRALIALSHHQSCTQFMTLLAAFQVLLYRYTDQTDIVVGTDIANRTHTETEQMIGFFVNLLALRTKFQGSPTFLNILQRVREMVIQAYTYQHMPFEMLIEHLRLERRLNQTSLINVLFVLQNVPRRIPGASSTTFEPVLQDIITARFHLAVFMREKADTITGEFIYNTDLFTKQTMSKLAEHFQTLLQNIINEPTAPIGMLDIYTDAEKEQQAQEKRGRRKVYMHKLKEARGKAIDI